jgi:hypothetical protein
VLARCERAELPVDERNDLVHEVVGIAADGGRVHILVAAQRRVAVREHQDYRSHPAFVHEPGGALRQVLAERLPVEVREARAGEADEVV